MQPGHRRTDRQFSNPRRPSDQADDTAGSLAARRRRRRRRGSEATPPQVPHTPSMEIPAEAETPAPTSVPSDPMPEPVGEQSSEPSPADEEPEPEPFPAPDFNLELPPESEPEPSITDADLSLPVDFLDQLNSAPTRPKPVVKSTRPGCGGHAAPIGKTAWDWLNAPPQRAAADRFTVRSRPGEVVQYRPGPPV